MITTKLNEFVNLCILSLVRHDCINFNSALLIWSGVSAYSEKRLQTSPQTAVLRGNSTLCY
jgi:hypothetical protein